MKKQLILMPVLLLMAYVALCQSGQTTLPYVLPAVDNNDMEHQMRADRIEQRNQSYEAFAGRVAGAAGSFTGTGALLAKQGKYDEALKQFDEAIYANKYYAEAYYNRGLVKQKLYRLTDAITDFDIAVGLTPYNVKYIESDADAKLSTGDLNGAIDGYNRLIAINKIQATAYLKRGIAEMNLKNNDAALADLTKAKQLGSNGTDSLMNAISPGSADKVIVYLHKDADDDNETQTFSALRSYAGPLSKNPEATRYNSIALDQARARNMTEAISNFSLAINADPYFASAYNNRGYAELITHNYRDAVNDYIKATSLDPKNVNAYTNCANAMYELKDYGGALKYFDSALRLDSSNVVNYNNRSIVKKLMKDYDGAIEDLEKCIQLNPQYTQALVNKACAEFEMNKKGDACADWAKARAMGDLTAAQYIVKNCY